MKKQFFRVKQLADQTFSRAGKTEALSDDLQDAERRIEFIRSVCLTAGKKLANPNTGHDSSAREKRLKKNAEYCLGISMLESSSSEDDHLLRQVVTDCGKLQMCLANTIVDHEMKIESNIVTPLLGVCENDYPNIMKLKRNLSKLILDMDSARTRYQTATKHSGTGGAGSKADSIKDELEEAEAKVEQCRDALACEMLQLIVREAELSTTILEYARLQKNYHVTAVAILDEIIPEMEVAIGESFMRPIFGKPLEEHLRVTGRKIAYPIELCVCGLLELGIAEEGLFRVAPGASKLRRMKLSLDAHCLDFESALQFRDPHVFAGVLKSYLRELPDPLLTHQLYEQWVAAARVMAVGNQEEGLNAFWSVLHSLPPANFDNLQYLVKFLASLASNKHSNKMSPQNIAIVIAPNLIWSPNEDTNNIGQNMTTANLHTIIVDSLVSFSDWFFPEEIEFYVTLNKDVVNFINGHALGGEVVDQKTQQESSTPNTQEMKRAQSNDSLSDHNSPPHGSPKPAVRVRKHKSTAPTPPIQQKKDDKDDGKDRPGNRESKDLIKVKDVKSPKDKDKGEERRDGRRDKCPSKETTIKTASKDPIKSERIATKETDKKIDKSASKESLKSEKGTTKEENPQRHVVKRDSVDKVKESEKKTIEVKEEETDVENKRTSMGTTGEMKMEFSQFESDRGSGSDLNRRTSKSGEDVRRIKMEDGGGYCTLRKPPRPMPRTMIGPDDREKPAIPERPPQLQRPLSFRIPKSPDQHHIPEDRNISLERTHMYSVDKQQVAIIQVNPDKVPNERTSGGDHGERPEKPKKPDSLVLQPTQIGHQRAASEGSIIDTGMSISTGMSRPPRPTPPPPPITSPKKESTDL